MPIKDASDCARFSVAPCSGSLNYGKNSVQCSTKRLLAYFTNCLSFRVCLERTFEAHLIWRAVDERNLPSYIIYEYVATQ
jgi:hypothetical protein